MQAAHYWRSLFCCRPAALLPIRNLRRVVVARDYGLAADDFRRHFPAEATDVFALFQAFVVILGRAARRPLQVGFPGYLGLTSDEQTILAIVAAAQADNDDLLDAHLCWLSRREHRDELKAVVLSLSQALVRSDRPYHAAEADAVDPLFASASAI